MDRQYGIINKQVCTLNGVITIIY